MKLFAFLCRRKSYKTPRVSRLYLKLRSKFTIFFFLLVMIPFLAFMFAAYFYSISSLEKNTYEMSLSNLNQEKNAISNYLKDLSLSIESFSKDPLLENLLQQSIAADSIQIQNTEFSNIASEHLTISQTEKLSSYYIIRNNKIIAEYYKNDEKAAINSPSSQAWFNKALAAPSSVQILGTTQRFYDGGRNIAVFSLAKAIESTVSGSKPAVLLLDFNYNILPAIAEPGNSIDNGEERLIADENGNILYSADPNMLTISPDEDILPDLESDKGFKKITYNGKSYFMTYERFPELPWTFISLVPTKIVTGKLTPSANPIMLLFIIVIPLILLLYLAVSSVLLNPINELTAVISDYEKGNFSDDPQLSLPLNGHTKRGRMENTSEIEYLIDKVYNIKLKQKEAELNSLQNQINPHFLYNTLESIRGAALYNGIHEIAAMSKALSLLFRYSISDKVLVSIKEEIQHLDNYMSIQNFRYENKFDLVYSIPPELYNYKILKLTLQPLIENSIKHGLEMKLGKGLIKVEIISLESNIRIQISDDGLGILPKKIDELNRALSKDETPSVVEGDRVGTGIGVKNVNSRIKLYFGEQYGLKFSDALAGTVVEITLPAVKDN